MRLITFVEDHMIRCYLFFSPTTARAEGESDQLRKDSPDTLISPLQSNEFTSRVEVPVFLSEDRQGQRSTQDLSAVSRGSCKRRKKQTRYRNNSRRARKTSTPSIERGSESIQTTAPSRPRTATMPTVAWEPWLDSHARFAQDLCAQASRRERWSKR